MIDHHHLARALHDEGVKEVLVSAVADLRSLDKDAFWTLPRQPRLDASVRRRGKAAAAHRHSRKALPTSRTIPIAASPASCASAAGTRRTRRPTANSCGPTHCVGASGERPRMIISRKRCGRRSNSPKAARRLSCRAGAGRMSGTSRTAPKPFSADGSLADFFNIVIPAQAGTHPNQLRGHELIPGRMPAFAGMAEMAFHPASLAFDQPL